MPLEHKKRLHKKLARQGLRDGRMRLAGAGGASWKASLEPGVCIPITRRRPEIGIQASLLEDIMGRAEAFR